MPCGGTGSGGSAARPPHSSPQGAASADGSEGLAQPPSHLGSARQNWRAFSPPGFPGWALVSLSAKTVFLSIPDTSHWCPGDQAFRDAGAPRPPGDGRGLFRAHRLTCFRCASLHRQPLGEPLPTHRSLKVRLPCLPPGFPRPKGRVHALPAGTCPPGLTSGLSCPSQAGPEGHPQCRAAGGPRLGHPGGLCGVPWPLQAPHTGSRAEPALPGAGELWWAGRICVGEGHSGAGIWTFED